MMLDKNIIKECCLNKMKNEWIASNDSFPDFLTVISQETKLDHEQYLETVSEDFKKQLNRFSRIPIGRKKWKHKTFKMLENVLSTETIIGIHHYMGQPTLDAFCEELKDFLRHVRQFSPTLSMEGIGQAIRNYIVYAIFIELNQMDYGFNLACFGYSMLYPFTDNYIDSKEYSHSEKQEYNQIIQDKIQGKVVYPNSIHQEKTCDLLQMIESEYPRDHDSTIFTLLLMMLEAQKSSLQQQDISAPLTAEELLDISLYKGGMSVLIDRYFVKMEINEEDLLFYLEFGFFLQLADDLQDIKQDRMDGHQTILTINLQCEQQEKVVNKMLHFAHHIMDSYQAENNRFKDFILSNCYQLIYSAVVGSKEFFSKQYMDQLEQYLPITFPFLENLKTTQLKTNQIKNKHINTHKIKNIKKNNFKVQQKYMKILDEMIQ